VARRRHEPSMEPKLKHACPCRFSKHAGVYSDAARAKSPRITTNHSPSDVHACASPALQPNSNSVLFSSFSMLHWGEGC
jgi:hypothetical protein